MAWPFAAGVIQFCTLLKHHFEQTLHQKSTIFTFTDTQISRPTLTSPTRRNEHQKAPPKREKLKKYKKIGPTSQNLLTVH